jgi:hypothetical protein
VEGCYFVSVCLFCYLSGLDQLLFATRWSAPFIWRSLFPESSISMCCVIYDLEGSNDRNPQDANSTLVGEIYLP